MAKLVPRGDRTLRQEREDDRARDQRLIGDLVAVFWKNRKRSIVSSESDAIEVASRFVDNLRPFHTLWRRSASVVFDDPLPLRRALITAVRSTKPTSKATFRGKPRDHRRRVLLTYLASALEHVGLRPTKSDSGVLAEVARVVLPLFDVSVPNNPKKLFDDVEYAVDAWHAHNRRSAPITGRRNYGG